MKSFRRALAPSALSALLLLATPLPAAEVIDRILVRVNARVVTQSHLDGRIEQTIRESGAPPDATRAEELKKALMEELVNETLLEDRARDLDLTTSDAEVEEQVKKLKEQNQVTTDEEFQKALATSGLTVDRLRDQLRRTLTVQRVVGREVNSKVDLSDDAMRVIYEREKEGKWGVPERARVAEVLIAPGDNDTSRAWVERRAKEASDKLKAGAKFEQVVKDYSDGGTKARGGDLGTVARGELAPEIDKAVFSLPAGGVTDPILTRSGWHLVKLVEKIPASYKPFAEVKAEILKHEQETQFQKKLAEYLDKLKHDAVIRVAPEAAAYYQAPVTVANPPAPPPATKGKDKKKKG